MPEAVPLRAYPSRRSPGRDAALGRRPKIVPEHGRTLSAAEVRRRYPGLSRAEVDRVLGLAGAGIGQTPVDRRQYGVFVKLPTAYDVLTLQTVAKSEGKTMGDLLMDAVRAFLAARKGGAR